MKDHFKERSTRTYRQKQLFTKAELEERESVCVHEQPAFCTAACPLKLDAREFVRLVGIGDIKTARAMLERIAPFPYILASGCHSPCVSKCRLSEVSEGISIGALERYVMANAPAPAGKGLLKFKKKKKAAVFGGSLFALAVAGEMANKSYPTTFYVAESEAADIIRSCASFLSDGDMETETKRLLAMDIDIIYNSQLGASFIDSLKDKFDLVFASSELLGEKPDQITLINSSGIITDSGNNKEVIDSLFDARRAGITADRLAQSLDPKSSRGDEGPFESRLYTDLSEVIPSSQIAENEGYTKEEAIAEASRCIQCACTECMKACIYLREFKRHPRLLTREIYNNTGIIMGDHTLNRAMNSCSLCKQCSVTCPFGYDMADICQKARANMVDTDKLSLAVHEFALLDMLFSNSEAFLSMLPPDKENCEYVFFPGCQAGAVSPETIIKSYADLRERLTGDIALMLGCCGAIAHWAGRTELYDEMKDFIKSEMAKLNNPKIIAGCPTCRNTLSEYLDVPVIGIWDILSDLGLPENTEKASGKAVIQDACAARCDSETQDKIRDLTKKLGYTVSEPQNTKDRCSCCGYGGLVSYANRDMAKDMANDRLKGVSDELNLTYCMACSDRFKREGADSKHILELIYGTAKDGLTDISEKRKNRLTLKQSLLSDVWGINVLDEVLDFELKISDEARIIMDDRMILESDIIAVMKDYHINKEAVYDVKTELSIATKRIGNVSFWVKFTSEGENAYNVVGAYSHRMTISKRGR